MIRFGEASSVFHGSGQRKGCRPLGCELVEDSADMLELAFQEREEKSGGNGHEKAGLGGDEGLGNSGGNIVDGLYGTGAGHACKGGKHAGDCSEKTGERSEGDENGKDWEAAMNPGKFFEFEESSFVGNKVFGWSLVKGLSKVIDLTL